MIGFVWMSSPALAACDAQLKALDAARGEAVGPAFTAAATCDAAKAAEAFGAAIKHTEDVDSLALLAEAAIGAGMAAQVHGMLEPLTDYSARDSVAETVGGHCATDPKVKAFVLGLFDATKGRTFASWGRALQACDAPEVTAALEKVVSAPPSTQFDEKYATAVDLYAGRAHAAGLPVLEKAAAASIPGGPYAVLVDAMAKSVTPEGIGAKPSDADRSALVAALGRLGANATPEVGQRLADTLVKIGAPDAAAGLLPKIYPGAVQPDGSFLYGVVAVEKCGDDAVVHWAVVEEPGKRWSIDAQVQERAKGFKARLKCEDAAPYNEEEAVTDDDEQQDTG
jgi:hypothetical protein